MKKIINCLLVLFFILTVNISMVFGYSQNYSVSEVLPIIQSFIKNQIEKSSKNKILFITVRDINLESDEQYQILHNTLQNNNSQNEIFDVYVTTTGQIIIPNENDRELMDDESKYTSQDFEFKSKLANLGVKKISIINQEKNFRMSPVYYNKILNTVARFYYKYFYFTDMYINHVYNTLLSRLEIGEIEKETSAVGEFIGKGKKIILAPKLFLATNESEIEKNKILAEYTVNHEMGHAVELSLCKKIFKDLNLSNISQQNLEKLGEVYFCGSDTQVSTQIKENVLAAMNAPINEKARAEFIKEHLTDYANTNASEFFAEAVAFGSWEDNSKNKEISKLVDEEIKNIIKGHGQIYENLKKHAYEFLKENNIVVS